MAQANMKFNVKYRWWVYPVIWVMTFINILLSRVVSYGIVIKKVNNNG